MASSVAEADDSLSPIVILASGPRCGSTLLQRLLCSHSRVLVWGEQDGALRSLFGFVRRFNDWKCRWSERVDREITDFGYDGFIANLMPPTEALHDGVRALMLRLFAEPAAALGRPRWGLKEIRYGQAEYQDMLSLFPAAKAVHLTRDPRRVLTSLAGWQRGHAWTVEAARTAMRRWVDINESFIRTPMPSCLTIRYETLIAEPHAGLRRIAHWFDIDPAELDHSVFDRRVHQIGGAGKGARDLVTFTELHPDIRRLVADDHLAEIAHYFGYGTA
ncbi:sulfotransferase family protein [Kibdelosporangium persicum]|nr:sulfotransferase [Kibdelosporangium persicum]